MKHINLEAHAKINWALRITGRRPDGYHELDMLMQSISLCDSLSFYTADETRLFVGGLPASNAETDLTLRALRALEELTGRQLNVHIRLEKRIPARAGLGGGSSDCAATLRGVNELFSLGLTPKQLQAIGLRLGSDVPYFIEGGLCRIKGIGEKLCPFSRAPRYPLLIKRAGGGLSTPEVYRRSDEIGAVNPEGLPEALIRHICEGDARAAQALSFNDLEPAACALEPEILSTINELRALPGAIFVRMSGSGSAVYAVFESARAADAAAKNLKGALRADTI